MLIALAILSALPPDCARANALVRRHAAALLEQARLPTRADIVDRWRVFLDARHECPYARLLRVNDDANPDLVVLLPARKSGYVIGALLSDGERYSVQLIERGDQRPQDRGVVHGHDVPGMFQVDFGDWSQYFMWDSFEQKITKVVIPLLTM